MERSLRRSPTPSCNGQGTGRGPEPEAVVTPARSKARRRCSSGWGRLNCPYRRTARATSNSVTSLEHSLIAVDRLQETVFGGGRHAAAGGSQKSSVAADFTKKGSRKTLPRTPTVRTERNDFSHSPKIRDLTSEPLRTRPWGRALPLAAQTPLSDTILSQLETKRICNQKPPRGAEAGGYPFSLLIYLRLDCRVRGAGRHDGSVSAPTCRGVNT